MLNLIITLGAATLLTVAGVEIYRRWSLSREVLDVPNERSSHVVPTPRGGGLVVVLVVIVSLLAFSGTSGRGLSFGFYFGALVVAGISLVDDLRGISPFVRLFFHAVAAGAVVFGFDIAAPGAESSVVVWGERIVFFVWIVWLINAYNFMDGIDGIAALQAVVAGVAWLAAGLLMAAPHSAFLGGITAAASLGFLLLNWQPAKIFMGDVGSAFLGFVFASLPIAAAREADGTSGWTVLFLGVMFVWMFVFDSVLTFLRRLLRGEKVWKAHREHLYQRLVIKGRSHASTTLVYGVTGAVLSVVALAVFPVQILSAATGFLIGASVLGIFLGYCWRSKILRSQ